MIRTHQRSIAALGLAVAMALCGLSGHVLAAPAKAEKAQQWSVAGGTVSMRWNRELASDIGLVLGAASKRQPQLNWDEHEVFELRREGSLEFDVRNGNLRGFLGGSLQADGGYVVDTQAGRIDLTDFRLVPRRGSAVILDVVSSDGKAWFYVDRLMYELIQNKQRLSVRTMDLIITEELARRLGQPEIAGWAIAEVGMTANVLRQGEDPFPLAASNKWHGLPVPGQPGATYQADLFMKSFFMQYMRCNGCTGVGGNGSVVFAPSSTLRNNINNGTIQATIPGDPLGTSAALYTADIPWHQMFTGNFAPYNNDQHPYLIWNMYRLNADGSIDQIGRSGVKHGFLTLNTSCLENPGNSHILGRGCEDVYSTGNNDSNNSLGPRTEIIPNTNQWGRCGSIYDTNCDGVSNTSGNGVFDQRMVVNESQFSGPGQVGATYLFESWYLARQDINIYNSMGTVQAGFTRNATTWSVTGNNNYKLGPAIDRWVDPVNPGPNARNVELVTPEGRLKVAVKATSLGGGLWRYDYAAMNMDFSRPWTEGAEPNLRVNRALGFDNFGVPVGTSTVTNLVFSDGDLVASNNWSPVIRDGRLTWWASSRTNALNWGTMFRFSFTINQAPAEDSVTLHIAADNSREVVVVPGLLVPGSAPAATAASGKKAAR
jgi:hypothetical protein